MSWGEAGGAGFVYSAPRRSDCSGTREALRDG